MNLELFSKEDFINAYQKYCGQNITPQLIAVAELSSRIYAEGFNDGYKKAIETATSRNDEN